MPLYLATVGERYIIRKISGKQEIRKHLENLGFVVGGHVTVMREMAGNLIVNVKDSRVALNRELAASIMIGT